MFPSFNCDNSFESLLKRPYFPSDQNPSSKQDHGPPFPFNFPSPFLDEHESPLSQIFLQNHQMAVNHSSDQIHSSISDHFKKKDVDNSKSGADQELPTRVAAPLRRRSLGVVPRRRTGKKDRHSKICTAQGVRDRRMRLSLQVARKFFDLQDMLGYDKASKTIEWLFTKSKKAIKDLMTNDIPQTNNNISMSDAKSESFLSECEVVSGLQEHTSVKESKERAALPAQIASKTNVKESRVKARARARSRTREKMMVKGLEHSEQWCKPNPTQNGDFQKLGFSNSPDQESKCVSPYEASCNSLDQYPSADVSTIERFLGNLSSLSSSWENSMQSMQAVSATAGCGISEDCSAAAVSDPNCSFMGFFGSWDSLSSDRTSSIYCVTNQDSAAGKPNSVYSATEELP